LLVVGRLRSGPLKELQAFYASRIVPAPAIVEIEEKRAFPPGPQKAREGKLILGALPSGTPLIALDAGGVQWSSRALAGRIGAWRDGGSPELAFAVGGPDGLHSAVLESAAVTLSLGQMTWPHLLVRGMLLEQLYRAQQILAGHPYHRE
jgi:23S rRNA (pseudouridine1915-N3)-methyltransferase